MNRSWIKALAKSKFDGKNWHTNSDIEIGDSIKEKVKLLLSDVSHSVQIFNTHSSNQLRIFELKDPKTKVKTGHSILTGKFQFRIEFRQNRIELACAYRTDYQNKEKVFASYVLAQDSIGELCWQKDSINWENTQIVAFLMESLVKTAFECGDFRP